MSLDTGDQTQLSVTVRRGLTWSALSTITLRMGTFAVGIVVARLLAPDQFGVYAVALTVQTILITLADLGLSADLIRCDDPDARAPTVATLGLLSGAGLSAMMALSAPLVAAGFGTPQAAPVIAVLSVTLFLSGAGTVPYAMLIRRFEQRRLFAISVVDFAISTSITVVLLADGLGVMSLAIARVATQSVVLMLLFVFARVRPRLSLNRALVRPVLGFGLPVALANLMSWAVINFDNLVVARVLGPLSLGFYALAFNVSSWPMTALGQVIRSVAMPAFSRLRATGRDASLVPAVAVTWALALPVGVTLAVLSKQLVEVIYGPVWIPAAAALTGLALFGALRVVFDLVASFLYSRGASRVVLQIQVVWFVLLIPSMVFGSMWFGLVGAAWAHVTVSFTVILPLYLWAAHRSGADLRPLPSFVWQPIGAVALASVLGLAVTWMMDSPIASLLLGGATAGATYLGVLGWWLRRQVAILRDAADAIPTHDEQSASGSAPDPRGSDPGPPLHVTGG